MATNNRRARTRPSSTTQKSSEKPTAKPQSESPESEKESTETSTQTTSTSSSSDEDDNDALFAEADQNAENAPESDDDGDDESEGAGEDSEAAEGTVRTFEVENYAHTYTFKGVINGNSIVVVEDATRQFRLPGSEKLGTVLAHHKGQILPLKPWQKFIKE